MRPALRSPRAAIEPDPAPQPPKRSDAARHPVVVFLNSIISLLVIAAVIVGGALFWGKQRFEAASALPEDRTVVVTRGMDVETITNLLQREGVIADGGIVPDRWIFFGGVWLNKAQAQLKAGEYLIPAKSSMSDIMELLIEGRSILHAVTLPEGLTSEQIVERLRADPILEGEIDDIPPEGSLLPETYKFTRGTTRKQMIERMETAHDRAVDEIWARRVDDLPVQTPEELVILASIVEKETSRADERTRVAGVFVNRLQRNMKLQSDPTIIYGLVGGKGKLGRPIRQSEIDKETPYNTYVIGGLPPGPIANPGRAALEAVANPSRTDDLFFVADGTGGHAFAATIEEHNRNVARWRAIERQREAERAKEEEERAKKEAAASETEEPAAGEPETKTDP